jgi:hypothetical protein
MGRLSQLAAAVDWAHGPDNPLPHGEVGILMREETGVENAIAPHCVLVIHYNDQDYLGSLSFDDEESLKTVCEVLKGHIGRSISAIGNLDIP